MSCLICRIEAETSFKACRQQRLELLDSAGAGDDANEGTLMRQLKTLLSDLDADNDEDEDSPD